MDRSTHDGARAPAGTAGTPFGEDERVQRREYVRVPASCPVQVTTAERSETFSSYLLDVSGGGMRIAGPCHLDVGEQIRFSVATRDDRPPIAGRGRVLRLGPQGETAVEIEQITEGDRRRLVRFVFECQREERRRKLPRDPGRVV